MMIVIMKKDATPSQLTNVVAHIEQMGCQAHISRGEERTLVGIIGNGRPFDSEHLEMMAGVEKTTPVTRPFKRASRDFHPQDTLVAVGTNDQSVGALGAGNVTPGGVSVTLGTALAIIVTADHGKNVPEGVGVGLHPARGLHTLLAYAKTSGIVLRSAVVTIACCGPSWRRRTRKRRR